MILSSCVQYKAMVLKLFRLQSHPIIFTCLDDSPPPLHPVPSIQEQLKAAEGSIVCEIGRASPNCCSVSAKGEVGETLWITNVWFCPW